MDDFLKMALTAVGASGIVGVVVTMIVTRMVNKNFERQDRREKLRDDNQFLMMKRLDNIADMTHLMANKMHDAKIINGDLKELDEKYQKLNEEYDENIKHLALEVLNGK